MASETELLDSTGLVAMLRDPNTGEVMHLTFPPGKYEIPLEAHLPARIAKVTLRAVRLPRGGEYDVRLMFDTNPPPVEVSAEEPAPLPVETRTMGEIKVPPVPPKLDIPMTSVMAPKTPEVTPVVPLKVEPSVPPPEASTAVPQEPVQEPVQATETGVASDAPAAALASLQEAPKGSAGSQETGKAPAKEAPKRSSGGGNR